MQRAGDLEWHKDGVLEAKFAAKNGRKAMPA
jgi:hypothetical protein